MSADYMHPLVSVIVPVYNGERYLSRCIDSIIAQTYSSIEIIIVDDGSLDGSGRISDEYAAKDNRIIVIHKENAGVSAARNKGLQLAHAKWGTFIDADDYIKEDYIEAALPYLLADDSYAITVSAVRINDEGLVMPYTDYKDETITIQTFIKGLKHFVSWGYFLHLETIKKNEILFDPSLSMSEDAVFMMRYFQYSPLIHTLNAKKYFYQINNDSVVQSGLTYRKSLNFYHAALKIHDLKENSKLNPTSIESAVYYQLRMFFSSIRKMDLTKDDYYDLKKKIRDLRYLVGKNERPKLFNIAAISFNLYKVTYNSLSFLHCR